MAKKKASRSASGSRAASKAAAPDAATRICVLHGPEDMLKREHLEALKTALAEAYGEVETITFEGKTATLAEVLDELRAYGLMQQHKLVIVDDADQFVSTHREPLERYAQNPVDHATLVLRPGRWYPGKLDKYIKQVGCLIKCEPVSEAQAAKWLTQRASRAHGCKIAPAAAGAMVERLGRDLGRLDAELAKLALSVDRGGTIEAQMVEALAGRGSDEQAWAVQEAFLRVIATGGGQRETGQAIAKLHELIDLAGQADVLVAYFLADGIRKLSLAKRMMAGGVSQGDVARELKIWPFERQKLFFAALRRLDDDAAGRIFDQIMTAALRGRSGLGDGVRNLEGFVGELTDLVSGAR